MSLFEDIVKATETEYRQFIETNPLFEVVTSGGMNRNHYVAYLRETYHMVRHTPRILSLAGARLGDEKREIRNWFIKHAVEENGHDLFCINDLRNIGEYPDKVLDTDPLSGAWGLITQNYYMATYGNPLGILGVTTATEGLGAHIGSKFAELLNQHYNIPINGLTFLKSHSGFDGDHLEDARKVIDELVSEPSDIRAIIQGRRMTFHHYGRLFLDVMTSVPNVVSPMPVA